MKTIVTTDEVCRLWANQEQWHAHNRQNNVYFNDSTIYSYGSHFPMARHVETKRGKGVLINRASYSKRH